MSDADDRPELKSDVVAIDERVLNNLESFVPPSFDDPADARRHRKQRLVGGLRLLADLGLQTGIAVAGHITVRDPEFADRFWVNPINLPFDRVTVADLLCVDHGGQILEGELPLNNAAFAIHAAIHRRFPHLDGACHAHAPNARPFSAFRRRVEPTSQDACAFYESQALFDDYSGVVLGEEGERIAEALAEPTGDPAGYKVCILANHGHIGVGETVDEAVFWFVMFDQLCRDQLMLEASGRTYHVLDHDVAVHTREQVGTRTAGYTSFQALFKSVLARHPDIVA
ncbi:MAG: class II aldolase/adducin family protein [Acidimicrobiales bacterium]